MAAAALVLCACQSASDAPSSSDRPTAINKVGIFTPASATALPDILTGDDTPYLPDFSYAGYKNGNVPLPAAPVGQVFNVSDFGAIPDDGLDDSKAVQRAVDAAKAQNGAVIVRFPAGRFILSDILYIERSDFALQGAGSGDGGTTLYYPRPMKFLPTPKAFTELAEYLVEFDKRQREPKNNIDLPYSLYAWSGGYIWTQTQGARGKAYLETYDNFPEPITAVTGGARGDMTITVADGRSVKVGDVLKIEWYNKQGENGSILTAMYGDRTKFKTLGSHHWNYPERALISQMTRITAVDGNRVTLSDPLLMKANPDWEPALVPWPHLANVSIEGFAIEFPNGPFVAHHVEDGYNAIYLTGLFDSYVRDIKITNADAGIISDDNGNVTIKDLTTTGPHRSHYTVHMGSVYNQLATGIRVENVAEHPLSFNTYAVKSVYHDSDVLAAPLLDQHSGANHQNLFDDIRVSLTLPDEATSVELFDGGGAGYWKPSHGNYSTFFNIDVNVTGGGDGPITLIGPKDGVGVRMMGVHGNREFAIDYAPDPYIEQLNQKPVISSLYAWQKAQRTQ